MLAALAEKARLTEEIFSEVPGITCNPVQGAMYTFPCITLPQKAIVKAKVWSTHTLHPNLLACTDNCMYKHGCVSTGGKPGTGHVLLYEAAGGGGGLPGAR